MGEKTHYFIKNRPAGFKICQNCNDINSAENKKCHNAECRDTKFNKNSENVLRWVEQEVEDWMKDGFMDDNTANAILCVVK